jgi:hypothetical protein
MGTDLAALTVGDTKEKWQYLAQGIGGKLGLDPDPVDADAHKIMVKPDAVRKAGIVQGLQDLGYLPERTETEETAGFTVSEIAAALVHWRIDTRRLRATYRFTFAVDASADSKRTMQSRELDLTDPLPILLKQTSYDGELQLYRLPSVGHPPSLLSRIFQFRLKTFNRYEATVGAPISQASIDTFLRLKAEVGFSESDGNVAFLNHLGNAAKLSRRFCERYRDHVFVYPDPCVEANDRIAGAYYVRWGRRSRYVARKERGRTRYVSVWDNKESPMLRYRTGTSNPPELATINNTEVNTLGLELLQLRLWQHGYYVGAIDADWGEVSRKALDEFFQSCEAFETDQKQIRDVSNGGYVLNLVYILNNLLPSSEETVANIKQENLNQIVEELFPENDADPDWSGLQDRAEETLMADSRRFVAKPVITRRRGDTPGSFMKTHRRRRLNFNWFGIKAAIGGWFRRFKKEVGQIAKKVRDFILEGVKSVQTVFRFALSKIKRVVRVATAAVHRLYFWLAGKPFGSGDPKSRTYIVSRWSTDFDTVNFCSNGCSSSIIKRHLHRIAFMNASFHFMISVALVVLEILVGIATQNWLKVAHSIYKAVVRLKLWNTEQDPYLAYLKTAA